MAAIIAPFVIIARVRERKITITKVVFRNAYDYQNYWLLAEGIPKLRTKMGTYSPGAYDPGLKAQDYR